MTQLSSPEFDESMTRARLLLSDHHAPADLWEANAAVNLALCARPLEADAWLLKAQILSALEDDPAALAAVEVALRRAPRRADAHYFRASVLSDMHRHADALRALGRAFKLVSAREALLLEDLYFEKAAILDASGRSEEAEAAFEEGLQRCPDSDLLKSGLEPLRRARMRQRLTVLPGGRR